MGRRQFGTARRLPSGKWQARYFGPDGLRRVAAHTFPTKKDALTWLTLRESELVRGEWTDPDQGRVLFGEYGDRWITEHKLGPRTRQPTRSYSGCTSGHSWVNASWARSGRTQCGPGAPSCCRTAVRQIRRPRRTGLFAPS